MIIVEHSSSAGGSTRNFFKRTKRASVLRCYRLKLTVHSILCSLQTAVTQIFARVPLTMSSSDLSDLSSSLSTDEDITEPFRKGTLDHFLKKNDRNGPASPPRRKRAPSPPHEYVLADNPDIAVSAVISFKPFNVYHACQ